MRGRRESGGGARQHRVKVLGAVGRPVDRQHEAESRHRGADVRELGQPLRVGDQRPRAGIFQPIGDRLDAEQHRQRQRDRAELVDGDVARGDGRGLRQQDSHPIAAPDAAGGERVGEPVRRLAQSAVADLIDIAVGADVEDRSAARLARGPAVADVDADIVARRHAPAERAIERRVVARGGKDMGSVHGGAG